MKIYSFLLLICLLFFSCGNRQLTQKAEKASPNILLFIADDWSYPHAGFYGDPVARTPNFDRLAQAGISFDHAYVSSPSCTPSRAALLSGQHFWRLREGANLYGPLHPEFPVYPDLLAEAGYTAGYTFKGWGPGDHLGRSRNPAGQEFESFEAFLEQRPKGKAFCFWYGSHNPHRGYQKGSGEASGLVLNEIPVPGCLPDSEAIRGDLADYYKEVQDFDDQIGEALALLSANGELENTLVIVTSDNGMPFPRGKSNLYDLGTRVPLVISWGAEIKQHFRVGDFVSLTDLAPTILEAVGLPVPAQMTGKSLTPYLYGPYSDPQRKEVFLGKERHVPGQEMGDWGGYPMRGIRTRDFLFIKNFNPDGWPAGTPHYEKASFFPSFYADVDGGPTRSYMLDHRDKNEEHKRLFELAFAKRPGEELYDIQADPEQLNNVADDPKFAGVKKQLERRLMTELKKTEDPRGMGRGEIFSSYPYSGGAPFPDDFQRQGRYYATQKIEKFPSRYVPGRTIEILTPVNISYDERFPVLYMFDGQNIFHEFKGWGGDTNRGWQVDEVLDSLYRAGTIPGLIVVGIFNGQERRMAEYMPAKPKAELDRRIAATEHEWYQQFKSQPPFSDTLLKYLVEEVKPYVDAHFKTKPDRSDTFVAGSSMGGLISAYAICEYPRVFGGAACLSTHWPPLDGVFLEYLKSNLPDPAIHKIYFDYGTEGLDAEYEPFQKIADAAMEDRGYVKGRNWITRKFAGATHHEKDWHARFHIPMTFLLASPK